MAKQSVSLRSPYVLLAVGVVAILLGLVDLSREERERRAQVSEAIRDTERCERDTGTTLERLPPRYRVERLSSAELASFMKQVPENYAEVIEPRDIYLRDRYLARVVLATVGTDATRRRDFVDGARDGAEVAGANPRERTLRGHPVLMWRAEGVANIVGVSNCRGLVVSALTERDARTVYLALAAP